MSPIASRKSATTTRRFSRNVPTPGASTCSPGSRPISPTCSGSIPTTTPGRHYWYDHNKEQPRPRGGSDARARGRAAVGLPAGRELALREALRQLVHRPPPDRERRVRRRALRRWRPDERLARHRVDGWQPRQDSRVAAARDGGVLRAGHVHQRLVHDPDRRAPQLRGGYPGSRASRCCSTMQARRTSNARWRPQPRSSGSRASMPRVIAISVRRISAARRCRKKGSGPGRSPRRISSCIRRSSSSSSTDPRASASGCSNSPTRCWPIASRTARGAFALRATVEFATDQDLAQPSERAWSLMWAAFRWTGDRKYLQPFLDAGPRSLALIPGSGLDVPALR